VKRATGYFVCQLQCTVSWAGIAVFFFTAKYLERIGTMTLKKLNLSLLLIAMVASAWSCGGGSSGTAGPTTSSIAAPTGVKAEATGTTLKVTWTAVDKAIGYVIYYATSSGVTNKSTTKLEVTSSATTGEVSGEVTGLSTGTYYAVVVSKDAKGESAVPSTEVSATLSTPTSGVALHAGAKWTKSDTGPTPWVGIRPETAADNGELLGNRDVHKGRVTFKITGIADDLHEKERWIIWLHTDIGGPGSNFQLMVVASWETRFIMQRFNDTTDCTAGGLSGGRWGCEEQDIHDDLTFDPNQTYAWDCTWDDSVASKKARCTATTVGGTFSTVYEVGMGGMYGPLLEADFGTFSIDGYPEVRSTVSDFRFSIM
jgi:hypothetical protein